MHTIISDLLITRIIMQQHTIEAHPQINSVPPHRTCMTAVSYGYIGNTPKVFEQSDDPVRIEARFHGAGV